LDDPAQFAADNDARSGQVAATNTAARTHFARSPLNISGSSRQVIAPAENIEPPDAKSIVLPTPGNSAVKSSTVAGMKNLCGGRSPRVSKMTPQEAAFVRLEFLRYFES
jgi:hypothetical protein